MTTQQEIREEILSNNSKVAREDWVNVYLACPSDVNEIGKGRIRKFTTNESMEIISEEAWSGRAADVDGKTFIII